MKKLLKLTLAAILLLLFAACGDDDVPQEEPINIEGTWKPLSHTETYNQSYIRNDSIQNLQVDVRLIGLDYELVIEGDSYSCAGTAISERDVKNTYDFPKTEIDTINKTFERRGKAVVDGNQVIWVDYYLPLMGSAIYVKDNGGVYRFNIHHTNRIVAEPAIYNDTMKIVIDFFDEGDKYHPEINGTLTSTWLRQ